MRQVLKGLLPTKYRNQPVAQDGEWFHSMKEARRCRELHLRVRIGEITDLQRQVRYPLAVNGVLIATYVADFVYREGGASVVEDVKSPATRMERAYRLKLKLMRAIHGIEIRET